MVCLISELAHEDFDSRWQGAFIPRPHWHFHRRLLARYGIVLGPGEFTSMVAAIQDGHALTLKARQHVPSIYSVRVESAGRSIFVLADRAGRLFTALPPGTRFYRLKKAAERRAE